MRLYIAGPMSNLPLFNFPEFDKADRLLKGLGIVAWSPAAHDRECGLIESHYPTGSVEELNKRMPGHMPQMMRWDVGRILEAEGILRLRGWDRSSGTALELAVNKAIGGRVFDVVYDCPDYPEEEPVTTRMVGIVEVFGA